MAGAYADLILPFRRFADFRGRARRTELVGFYLVAMLANVASVLAVDRAGETFRWLGFGLWLVLLCSMAALAVRRLHDVGLTGWWLAPLLPLTVFGLWQEFERVRDPFRLPPDLPTPITLAAAGYLLAMMVLLLWNDEKAANRFGANPRSVAAVPLDFIKDHGRAEQ